MTTEYILALLWSLVIFASFWGYGEVLRRALNRPEYQDIGWGLTATWGMGVTLLIGGVLMMLSAAKTAALTMVVLLGVVFVIYFAALHFTEKKKPLRQGSITRSPFLVSDLILWAFAALAFASSIAWPLQMDLSDDIACYLFYPEKILQTGTLIEPFNVRRMGTYGGQAFLQALVMIVGGEKQAHIPDRGFGMLLLFGMVLHLAKGISKELSLLRFVSIGCLFLVAVPRINTGSSLTGAAMIFALLLTLSKLLTTPTPTWKSFVSPALLIASAGTFRMTYLLCAAGIVVFEPVLRHWRKNNSGLQTLKASIAFIAPMALGSLILLMPWMFVLWQSNGTPMFPPFPGNMNPEFTILGNKGGAIFDIAHALTYLLSPQALVLIFCLGLSCFTTNRSLAYSSAFVALAVSFFTSYKFGVTGLYDSYRYTFPMIMPASLWILICALSGNKEAKDGLELHRLLPVTLVLALLLAVNLPDASRELASQAETLPQQATSSDPLVNPVITNALRELQARTPIGSKILSAVDTPYGFDFSRNEICTVDMPGGSAIGKWPLGEGPLKFQNYLALHGFKYIICSDFENSFHFYTRKLWKNVPRPEWYYKEINGKYFLDFMDNVDAIAREGNVVATAANLRLIELKKTN